MNCSSISLARLDSLVEDLKVANGSIGFTTCWRFKDGHRPWLLLLLRPFRLWCQTSPHFQRFAWLPGNPRMNLWMRNCFYYFQDAKVAFIPSTISSFRSPSILRHRDFVKAAQTPSRYALTRCYRGAPLLEVLHELTGPHPIARLHVDDRSRPRSPGLVPVGEGYISTLIFTPIYKRPFPRSLTAQLWRPDYGDCPIHSWAIRTFHVRDGRLRKAFCSGDAAAGVPAGGDLCSRRPCLRNGRRNGRQGCRWSAGHSREGDLRSSKRCTAIKRLSQHSPGCPQPLARAAFSYRQGSCPRRQGAHLRLRRLAPIAPRHSPRLGGCSATGRWLDRAFTGSYRPPGRT